MDTDTTYPTIEDYDEIGKIFDKALDEYVSTNNVNTLEVISSSSEKRSNLASAMIHSLSLLIDSSTRLAFSKFISFDIEEGSLGQFIQATVDAFFDNDLLQTVRTFLENSKGSFGLCVATSIEAHRQVCIAAKGQTNSVAFYPRKGVICYGSEQAAVKAGLNYDTPQGTSKYKNESYGADEDAVRLDLDDLGGEICLLDWGYGSDSEPAVSPPNRHLSVDKLMGGGVNVVLFHLSIAGSTPLKTISQRLVVMENNEFIKPLLNDCDDPVLADIRDIPRICSNIQEDWKGVGLNRMTACHLAHCVRERMKGYVDGTIENHGAQVDILVTGCEVSLWVAEQFISDLKRCFPKMYLKAVSSNKLLGLFGQELSMPCVGHPLSQKALEMKDPIIIIVSHSGGTFSPLACSNLLQSFSSSIFVVTSEWDTQIGKQLRSMYSDKKDLLTSRIFSTECGVRSAEPCSVSVVATHQLLTNIFEHICVTIISDPQFRHVTGSVITERDLQTLERCNRDNIKALERIVGVDRKGIEMHDKGKAVEMELRAAGDVWSEHILENAKAYIMSITYIIVTVTLGWPFVTGLCAAAGLQHEWARYITRFVDALIYIWLPQINILILRKKQGRTLRHRMVARNVIIGDPWLFAHRHMECELKYNRYRFACSTSTLFQKHRSV
mmetsp:Transcript_5234/g.9361  ORF Transcript_5234/g.9361 Transcript_5234/m.9361 type:complete len:666 (-) Transcript_5234:2682-4679(-)